MKAKTTWLLLGPTGGIATCHIWSPRVTAKLASKLLQWKDSLGIPQVCVTLSWPIATWSKSRAGRVQERQMLVEVPLFYACAVHAGQDSWLQGTEVPAGKVCVGEGEQLLKHHIFVSQAFMCLRGPDGLPRI